MQLSDMLTGKELDALQFCIDNYWHYLPGTTGEEFRAMKAEIRNPPSEALIAQFAHLLKLDKDVLCLIAGTIPQDLKTMATTQPEKMEKAFKAFRRSVKGN